MIVSASRRTDIPAFYSEWLLNRLREGYALVQNPRNPMRFSRVELNPQAAECLVFWTKNPEPMIPKLAEISARGYPFYFQFTLTPYGRDIEPNLPPKPALIESFRRLSGLVGPERVVWRYDPVILTEKWTVAYHIRCFEKMAAALEGYTCRCVFSFLDFYPKVRGALRKMGAVEIRQADMRRFAAGFSEAAQKRHIRLFACCEPVDLSRYGIAHAACIDPKLVESILGCPVLAKKDANQRPACGCMESVEIGAYDSCPHGCRYCYATASAAAVRNNMADHDPKSPVLCGRLPEGAIVTERKMPSVREGQMRFF